MNNKTKHSLLSDEPVFESEFGRQDSLKFGPTAEVLARAALYTPNPITIGVCGNWGSGKTSLMRLMMEFANKKGGGDIAVIPVWFNAWQYEREEHLIIPLIATIARDITAKEKEWEKISLDNKIDAAAKKAAVKSLKIMRKGGEKIHAALRSVLYGISMGGKLEVPGIGELEISASMKDMIERYEELTQDTMMARSLYFDAFDNLHEVSHKKSLKKPRIVVFIDDLDRCFPEQAVRLIESIKLVLHQPGFAFVLGIYPKIIEEFIRNKYAKDYHTVVVRDAESDQQKRMFAYFDYFKEYLGKIIQVRYDLPEYKPDDLHQFIENLIKETNDEDVSKMEQSVSMVKLYTLIAEIGKHNPREIVRKLNRLIVKLRIKNKELKDEERYELLALLINEVANDSKYKRFRNNIVWVPQNGGVNTTIGHHLAEALEDKDLTKVDDHIIRIKRLREKIKIKNSATMESVLNTLEQDADFCNILMSELGRKWLSEKAYRIDLRETFKDEMTDKVMPDESDDKPSKDLKKVVREIQSEMVEIKGGPLKMGNDKKPAERPVHDVMLESFKIGAMPVTQAQYKAIMNDNPSQFEGNPYNPVENVSWEDAMVFCERLSKETGHTYTLPTEAQWEYACRANHETDYPFEGSENKLGDYGWYKNNSEKKTHHVGKKAWNGFGLYDMLGNVWEWCLDPWHSNYDDAPKNGSVWESEETSLRVVRGGAWDSDPMECRSSARGGVAPNGGAFAGFRLVRILPSC